MLVCYASNHTPPLSILAICFAVVLMFTACKKENIIDICDDPLCTQYQAVWKDLLMRRNDISEDWFQEHISVNRTFLRTIPGAYQSLHVLYTINIDWAALETADAFAIFIDSAAPDSIHFWLPKNAYLGVTEISAAVDSAALGSTVNVIAPVEALAFATETHARHKLERATGLQWHRWRLWLGRQDQIVPADGHLHLIGERKGETDITSKRGILDLVTTGTRTVEIAIDPF
jgi:hypothetical protein